jgi:succinylglutamic semialdehyde dehydrogenase
MRPGTYIDGAWGEGGGPEIASIDPHSGEEVWRVASADAADVAAACESARAAFPGWARTPLEERVAILNAYGSRLQAKAATLSKLISREMGKPRWDADAEVQAMIGKIGISIAAQTERAGERAAPTPFGQMRLAHRPHGVMAVLGPFNFPGHLPNGHLVPALLAGNTAVFKPSELTPSIAIEMIRALEDAGLPDGVVNLVCGGRATGEALIAQPSLNGVLFTGSAQTGVAIHRAFAGRPEVILALEMGGNNPLIVWPPTDPAACANLIVQSAFITTGQRCSCARRLIVPEGAPGDALIEALLAAADGVMIGAPDAEPAPFMGPLASSRAGQAARAFETSAIAAGARSVRALGGEGAYVAPAILIWDDPAVVPDEECFAPLLHILRAPDLDAAITLANATRFGLAGGLISDDPAAWARVQRDLRVGVLNWNRPTTGASGMLPFGGPGLSGSGRPSAYYAADYCAYPVASQTAETAIALPAPGLAP